jgi:glycerophosphoryl diester phosphodiesterase
MKWQGGRMMNLRMGQRVVIVVLSICCVGLLLGIDPLSAYQPLNKHSIPPELKVIAHRGASGIAPENTMAAFEKAIQLQADYIELDIQISKDDQLVVLHDRTVDRTTDGTGEVKSFEVNELKNLDAGSFFNSSFAGERIPTLEEVLGQVSGRIGVVIEMKEPSKYPKMVESLVNLLIAQGLDKPENEEIIVQSFDVKSLQAFHKRLPHIPIGILIGKDQDEIGTEEVKDYAAFASFVNPQQSIVDEALVELIHGYGMKIWPWTIRKADQVDPLLNLDVDGLVTDYPNYFD